MGRGLRWSSCLDSDDDEEDKDDEDEDEDDAEEDDEEVDKQVLSWPSTVLSATILQGRESPNTLPSLTTALTS